MAEQRDRPRVNATLRLKGGPFSGQTAVVAGVSLGSLIEIRGRSYRVKTLEPVPGRRDHTGTAQFEKPATPDVPGKPRPPPLTAPWTES